MVRKDFKKHKFDTSEYITLDDGLRRIDTNKIGKALKEDSNLYFKELKEAVKKLKCMSTVKNVEERDLNA